MEHKFKKKYGQNFLKDKTIVNKIVETVDIGKNNLVIEIGPGAGILTEELVKMAGQVIAYEIDIELKSVLNNKFGNCKNLEIIWEDFLKRDIAKDIEKYNYENIYVIANIPYYITTPIIEKLIDSKVSYKEIVMMVQKEVGERFSAKPGNKEYGSITVFLNYYFDVKKLFVVSRKEFVPEPNVDSVIISLSKKEKAEVKDEEKFFKLIKDCFQFKRKNLRNNLKQYPLELIEEVLSKYGYDLTSRAEELILDVFIDICNEL